MMVFLPATMDALFVNALNMVISNWTIWGFIFLIAIGAILAVLKIDAWASALILFVVISILGAPVVGLVGGTIFNMLFYVSVIGAGFFLAVFFLVRMGVRT